MKYDPIGSWVRMLGFKLVSQVFFWGGGAGVRRYGLAVGHASVGTGFGSM